MDSLEEIWVALTWPGDAEPKLEPINFLSNFSAHAAACNLDLWLPSYEEMKLGVGCCKWKFSMKFPTLLMKYGGNSLPHKVAKPLSILTCDISLESLRRTLGSVMKLDVFGSATALQQALQKDAKSDLYFLITSSKMDQMTRVGALWTGLVKI